MNDLRHLLEYSGIKMLREKFKARRDKHERNKQVTVRIDWQTVDPTQVGPLVKKYEEMIDALLDTEDDLLNVIEDYEKRITELEQETSP
jgi:hypothetical protein